jgi:hypothetical protein
MGRDMSDELTGLMPVVPHGISQGVECCGCIVAVVEDKNVELQCNECGAVVGVIQIDILYVVQGDLNGWPRGKARRSFTGRRLR